MAFEHQISDAAESDAGDESGSEAAEALGLRPYEKKGSLARMKDRAQEALSGAARAVAGGAGKFLEGPGNVLAGVDWLEKVPGRIKNVAVEWKNDVVETVRMNTVDKWKFMNEKEDANALMQHKVNDIADLKGRALTEEHNITIFESAKAADDANFSLAVGSAKNPFIRDIFKKSWDEKTAASEASILNARTAIEDIDKVTMHYARQIVTFGEKTRLAGEAFRDRIDARIDKIREKCGYYEFQENLDFINRKIGIGEGYIRGYDEKIAEHSEALDLAREIGVSDADCKILENGIAQFEAQKYSTQQVVEKLRKSTYGLYIKIQNIDGKTRKYEDMKKEMGLVDEEHANEGVIGDNDSEGPVSGDEESTVEELADNNEEYSDEEVLENHQDDAGAPADDVEAEYIEPEEEKEEEETAIPVHEPEVETAAPEMPIQEDSSEADSPAVLEIPLAGHRSAEASAVPEEGIQYFEDAQNTESADGHADESEAAAVQAEEELQAAQPEEAEEEASDEVLKEERRESANRAVAKTAQELYKLVSTDTFRKLEAHQILDKTLALGKILAEYEDVLTKEEDEYLSKGFKEIQQDYNRRNLDMTSLEAKERIKKDVLNKVIRELPRWIEL